MDNERALKIELRQALDDVLPPAPWLEAAVREDLRKRRSLGSLERGSQHGRRAWPRTPMQLAAGVLVVVLALAAVATFFELRSRSTQVAPAGALTIRAYQAMVGDDVNRLDSSGDATSCATLQSVCPAPGHPVLTALYRWSDDLSRSQPPARFSVIDGQLRHHLDYAILFLNAVFAAYHAQDQTAFDDAGNAFQRQIEWLDAVSRSVIYSMQETANAHIATIQAQKQNLAACTECQSLASTSQNECALTEMQKATCEADVAYAKTAIQDAEATVVRYAAPDSMAVQDALLQRDLSVADAAVLKMANAQLTDDQALFASGHLQFEQFWPQVNADIASILGG